MSRYRRPPRNRLRYENLEARRLMVGSIELEHGILTFEGTDEYAECAHVEVDFNNTYTLEDDLIIATMSFDESDCSDPSGSLQPLIVPRSDVNEIHFWGRGKNDRFENESYLPSWGRGGNGSDTLIGSNQSDTLIGDLGNDSLRGGGGDDLLRGGDPNSDNGILYSVDGPDGEDTLRGNGGDDILRGGTGEDVLIGGEGEDSLFGGYHDDALNGGIDGQMDLLEGGPDHGQNVAIDVYYPEVGAVPGAKGEHLQLTNTEHFSDCFMDAWNSLYFGDSVYGYSGEQAMNLCNGETINGVIFGETTPTESAGNQIEQPSAGAAFGVVMDLFDSSATPEPEHSTDWEAAVDQIIPLYEPEMQDALAVPKEEDESDSDERDGDLSDPIATLDFLFLAESSAERR